MCWVLKKNSTTLVYLISNCRQVLNSFKTNPLNIIFDDISIWLLGYRTRVQLSTSSTRAYIHKYCVAMKYRWIYIFDFERKSIFKAHTSWPFSIENSLVSCLTNILCRKFSRTNRSVSLNHKNIWTPSNWISYTYHLSYFISILNLLPRQVQLLYIYF